MPEGPEIRRAADELEQAVGGQPLTRVWFASQDIMHYAGMLVGTHIVRIDTRGKAMLTHFSDGMVLYTHNQLFGVWKVVDAGVVPSSTRTLRIRLETASRAILLYSASTIELLEASQLDTIPFLRRLGPDALDKHVSTEQVRLRLLDTRFSRRQLGALLLDQTFIAGIGNYLRAEILWEAQLSPFHPPRALQPEQLAHLADAILAIPRCSYRTRGDSATGTLHHGTTFHFKVYHRAGEPCPRCFQMIEKTVQHGRPLYWCPHCQR